MKLSQKIFWKRFLPDKVILTLISGAFVFLFMASGFRNQGSLPADMNRVDGHSTGDSLQSVQAFMKAYQVLMSPRCVNCHPAGDVPLQGEDSHLHESMPKRGPDGKGMYALKCANCHQAANVPGLHMPPGNPKWSMPPEDMKMIFQGRTAHELAKQLTDPEQNGHKNREQLIEHVRDTLVAGAWNPGEGRMPPPLSYEDFKKAWDTWINEGAYAPRQE